jgi:hypothetical protein
LTSSRRDKIPITVYLPPEVIDKLRAEGETDDRPISAVARKIILAHFK